MFYVSNNIKDNNSLSKKFNIFISLFLCVTDLELKKQKHVEAALTFCIILL